MKIFISLFLLVVINSNLNALGNRPCVDPFSTISWKFFFDGFEIGTYGDGSSNPTCACLLGDGLPDVGIKMKLEEPIGFIEMVNEPFNFPCFQKSSGSIVKQKNRGTALDSGSEGGIYRNAHFINYPVFSVLNLFLDQMCLEDSAIDIPFMGELEPQWSNDFVANTLHPENILFSNPLAQAACIVDCAASTAGEPMTSMPWCHGCWPTTRNGTGRDHGQVEVVESASLAMNVLDWMHMTFRISQTVTTHANIPFIDAVSASATDIACGGVNYFPKLIKQAFHLQPSYPVATEPIVLGESPILWSQFKTVPGYTDRIFTVWRSRFCCFGLGQAFSATQ